MNRFYTKEQENEIVSLIKEGFSVDEVVELLTDKFNRPRPGLKAKIYFEMQKLPEAIRKKIDRRGRKPYTKKIIVSESSADIKAVIASKIEIVGIKVRKEEVIFPIVARHFVNRHIVLFTSLHRGVVLHTGNSNLHAGYVNDNLIPCTDPLQWEILNEVTLTFKS